jgi:two-component system, chemotaxis family, sensor histidine kinase and response regulator WspE
MSDFSLLDLFKIEVENQLTLFTESLLELEKQGASVSNLEALMRAGHSIKGAARLVGVKPAEKLAHVLEDAFCAAQVGTIQISANDIDAFLLAADMLKHISLQPEGQADSFVTNNQAQFDDLVQRVKSIAEGKSQEKPALGAQIATPMTRQQALHESRSGRLTDSILVSKSNLERESQGGQKERERSLRLTADRLDALVGLAGEVQVSTGRLATLSSSLVHLKRKLFELNDEITRIREDLSEGRVDHANLATRNAELTASRCSDFLSDRLDEIDNYDRRMFALASRLHQAVISSKMCAFSEGAFAFPRLVRDLGRELNKDVELTIEGRSTSIDRDILERIESPLTHLLRNAVDHGIESPEERMLANKSPQARIILRAAHRAGVLAIEVIDDGRGIHLEELRHTVVRRKLTSPIMAEKLTAEELYEFLYLPKFSTKEKVGEISGRGVGLDVVRSAVVEVGGKLSLQTSQGGGCHFTMTLPLTLSVSRNLLCTIDQEIYAFPLNRIYGVCLVKKAEIQELQGKSIINYRDQKVPLLTAHQLLECENTVTNCEEVAVVLLERSQRLIGIAVDTLIGEQDLVIQTLDSRFGKLRSIASGSILEDGSPVLVLDVEDLHVSIEKLSETGRFDNVRRLEQRHAVSRQKRILVVDDSITVREVERKILEMQGYEVEVAVDGMDGWHAVRTGNYDLVVSDVDMPRMDGIKLVAAIRSEARTKSLPVIIVSYKDSEQDRMRGLDAGADFYLTKSSFDDDTFVRAVRDLIGASST